MKTFQTYFWQLLSTLLALVAIFATYNVFFLQREKKELQIVTSQPISLVDVKPEAKSDIQVLYKNEPVTSLYLYQVQIVNSGNQPIIEGDYSREVTLSFPTKYQIVDVAISSAEPPNIGLSVEKTAENRARIIPALLNPKDTVSVRFILLGNDSSNTMAEGELKVDGRIVGVNNIQIISSEKQQFPIWAGVLVGALVTLVVNFLFDFALRPFVKFLAERSRKRVTG
jgi:hypothetical protein